MKNNKNNKMELRVVDGKIVSVPAENTAAVNKTGLSITRHKALARKLTKNIHKTVPVISAIVIRARNNNGQAELYTETFKTLGSNNPNAIALMSSACDFNVKGQAEIQLADWNEKEKTIEKKYKIKCNDKTQDRVYYETNTHCVVIYGALDGDINEIYKNATDEQKRAKKKEFVDRIENLGLIMDANNEVHVASNAIMEGRTLSVLNWSPSNMRNETQLMTPIKPDEAFKILDEVSGGALSQALQGELSIEALIKASARLGILGAPAIPMVNSANAEFGYVIYMKEIQGPADFSKEENDKLVNAGIKIDTNTYDGAFAISVEMIKATFARYGMKLSTENALSFAVQTRATKFFTKVFGEAKTQDNMQFRLQKLLEATPKNRVLRVEAGTDVSNLNKADYDLIIVGNEACLGSIIDTNGGKLLNNISLQTIADGEVMTYLLDVAKCSKTATSGQMLQKFLTANMDATIAAVLACMGRNMDNKLEEKLYGEVNPHKCSLAEFILRYAANGKNNSVALESVIKEELRNQESMIKNLKVDIDAYFQRALFDDTYFLTNGKVASLLGRNKWTGRLECYSRDIEVQFADEIDAIESRTDLSEDEKDKAVSELLTGVAFKYPSPSSDENAILTYQTSKQLERRINNLFAAGTITEQERNILSDDFLNTSYGVTKLGADNTLKHKLAGMDTDYDGIAVVFEKSLVDILLAKYPETDGVATIIC